MKTRKPKKNRDSWVKPESINAKYGDGKFFEDSRQLTAAEREMMRYEGGDGSGWERN
jgi:hypothetical protein